MLDDYYQAFSRFLRGGSHRVLAGYCEAHAELAVLDIYRNGFYKTCADVLRANYPSVVHLVGEDCFKSLARRHVEAHPPRRASLVTYGEGFAEVIETTRALHGLGYLSCVAKLDRAWTEVYFAADAEDPDAEALAGMTERALMALGGRLAPCARRVSLDFGVLDAWTSLRQGGLDEHMTVGRAPLEVLVWRSAGEIAFRALGSGEQALVDGIAAGRSCTEAAMAAVEADADFDVAGGFAALLRERILSFDLEHPPGETR